MFIHELEVGDARTCACIFFSPSIEKLGDGLILEDKRAIYVVNGSEFYIEHLKREYQEVKYKKL